MSTMLGIKKEYLKNFEENSEAYLKSLEQFPKIQLEKTAINKSFNTPLVEEIKGNNLKDWTIYTFQKYFTFQSRQYLNRTDSEIKKLSTKQTSSDLEKKLKELLFNDKDKESLNVNLSSSELDLSRNITEVNKIVSEWMDKPVLISSFEDLDIVEIDQVYRDFLLKAKKPVIAKLLELLDIIENDKATLRINNENFSLLKPTLISEGVEELKNMSNDFNKNQYNAIIREINSLNSVIEKIKDSFRKTIENENEKIWSFSNNCLTFWEDIKKKNNECEVNKKKNANLFKDSNEKLIPKFSDYWNDNVASHIKKGKKKKGADNFMKGKTDEEILAYMDKTFEDFFNNTNLYNQKWREEIIMKAVESQRELIKEIETKLVEALTLEKERLTKCLEDENQNQDESAIKALIERCQNQLEQNSKIQENWEKLVQELIKGQGEQQEKLQSQFDEIISEYKKSINLTGRLEKVNKKDFMKQIKSAESQAGSNRFKDFTDDVFTIESFDEPILNTLLCLLEEGEMKERNFIQTRYVSLKENQKYNELLEKRKNILSRCQNEIMAGFIHMGIKLDSLFIEESCRMSETSLTFQKLGISVSSSKKNKKKKSKKKKSASAPNSGITTPDEEMTETSTVDTPEPEVEQEFENVSSIPTETIKLDVEKEVKKPSSTSKPKKSTSTSGSSGPVNTTKKAEDLIKQSIEASEKIIKKEAANAEKQPPKMLFTAIVNKPVPEPMPEKKTTTTSATTATTTTTTPTTKKSTPPKETPKKTKSTAAATTTTVPSFASAVSKPAPKSSSPSKVKSSSKKIEEEKPATKETKTKTVVEKEKTPVKSKSKKEEKPEEKLQESKPEPQQPKPEPESESQSQSQPQPQEETKAKEEPEVKEETKEEKAATGDDTNADETTTTTTTTTKEEPAIPKTELINEEIFTNGSNQKEPSEDFNLFKRHDNILAGDLLNDHSVQMNMNMNMTTGSFNNNIPSTAATLPLNSSIPVTTAPAGFPNFSDAAAAVAAASLLNNGAANPLPNAMTMDPAFASFLANVSIPTTVTPPMVDITNPALSQEQLLLLVNHLQNENQQLKLTLNKMLQQMQQFTNQKCLEISKMAMEYNRLNLQLVEKTHTCTTLEGELEIQKAMNKDQNHTIEALKSKIDGLLHHHHNGLGGRNNSEGANTKYNGKERKPFGGYHHPGNGSFREGRSGSYNSKFGGFGKNNGGNNNNNSGNNNGAKPPGLDQNGWRKQTSKSSTHGHHSHFNAFASTHPHGSTSSNAGNNKKEKEDHSIPTSNIFASLNDDEHDSDTSSDNESLEENEVEVEVEVEENGQEGKMVEEPEAESGVTKEEEKEEKAGEEKGEEAEEKKEEEKAEGEVKEEEKEKENGATQENPAENETTPVENEESAAAPPVPIIPEPEPMPEIEATTTSAAELLG